MFNSTKFMDTEKLPKISIVTCTYNGERVIEEYFSHIFSQNYPLEKIELIIADGGSKDKTLEIIKKYEKLYPKTLKFMINKKQYSIGKGFGMDNATQKATGEIIFQLDQDNILIQKDWLLNIVKIFLNHPEITAVQSRMSADKTSTSLDRYMNDLGIEDPFAINYSLNAQISLNPQNFKYNKEGDFYTYTINKKNFFYAGDNGFAIRKKEFREIGGYTQDIDNFYRMANSKKTYTIAIPRKIKLHHKTSTSLKSMLSKRVYYAGHYVIKNFQQRDFYWFNLKHNTFRQNLRFLLSTSINLAIFPALIKAINKSTSEKKPYWFWHPLAVQLMTSAYIYAFFKILLFKEGKESAI